ncbi:MAG: N-6 DNA methylase [Bacteroidota bacterium]|nr:N-6 DNA methylase [Bacteroidota bacterium]
MSANERTFQGELYRIINDTLQGQQEIQFSKITQEENVGKKGQARFADGKLYSSSDKRKIVSFELKDTKWDATDEILVTDAMTKAFNNGYEYFVTGTPRQLVVYKTFQPNTTVAERKLKIYTISTVKNNNAVLLPQYEKEIAPKLKLFLRELSDLTHGVKEVHWDSIDKYFVNKLSSYILEASVEMAIPMYEKIRKNKKFRYELKQYLKSQDIFNVTLNFDQADIYKVCQLSNYLLYLKIIFYTYLQRDVPELDLKPLEIPEDKKLLNKKLRQRFDDVLKHDFEMIFEENILDQFEFEANYLPMLKENVEQIRHLNFTDLNADIIGAIYNTLIDNQEQHDRGQHFTNTNEVDIVNAFCITESTDCVLDSGCGAGTFLVRAYFFLKNYHNRLTHQQLLEKIWGVEIASFPTFLSTMNLSLLNIKTLDNYPVIIHSDFSKVQHSSTYTGMFLNVNRSYKVKNLGNKKAEVKFPVFDACVGNPPYIRQELIINKESWSNLALNEFGIKKVNLKSDLYVYYLMHTAAFLKEGGRLGYVISASWLDISFGTGLQKFLLNNFKIIAIIDHQKKRSFETASINTVILIIEKCSQSKDREKNDVKFVRVFADYEKLIGNTSSSDRFKRVNKFAQEIETTANNFHNDDLLIDVVNQKRLELNSTINGIYENGHWGAKYLRSPDIFNKIISLAGDKLIPLSKIIEVKYGIKTGANDFFYLTDETEKAKALDDITYRLTFGVDKTSHLPVWEHLGWFHSELTNEHFYIEKEFIAPVFKTQREALNLDVDIANLKNSVIICSDSRDKLSKQKKNILKYIKLAEQKQFQIDKRPSCQNGDRWYDLTSKAAIGDFIFPAKIGEKFRLIDNRKAQVYCDKVNYVFRIREEYLSYSNIIFLILNSILFRYFVDLFARQLTGSQTLSDVDVNLVQQTLIIDPTLLSLRKKELMEVYKSLKHREQETIYEEVLKPDKKKLDTIILEELGLRASDVYALYSASNKYVKDRQEKSESLVTSKSKGRLNYDDALALIKDRFSEVIKYNELIKGFDTYKFDIPEWKAMYPKGGVGSENLFGIYNVFFVQGDKKKSLSFENIQQLELFKFFNSELEVKGIKLSLPKSAKECKIVFTKIEKDYLEYIDQIKSILKSNRSTANYQSIYKDLLFSK